MAVKRCERCDFRNGEKWLVANRGAQKPFGPKTHYSLGHLLATKTGSNDIDFSLLLLAIAYCVPSLEDHTQK